MPTKLEIELTLAELEDWSAFDDLYLEFEETCLTRPNELLRQVCHLWFNRGVARGLAWTEDQIDRGDPGGVGG
jgi:hypothetical protein